MAETEAFAPVEAIGLRLHGVETIVRSDGAPGLARDGRFMAALARHPSAEPSTLVVRVEPDVRDALIDEAPDSYYLTDYYDRHGVVLARLDRLTHEALADLLSMSWRLSVPNGAPVDHS
ncbi:MAG TPA: hypothetical protein VMF13_01685 [Luteitalea sp.]|nr:hypothetical protein [Luteitalea sp.]